MEPKGMPVTCAALVWLTSLNSFAFNRVRKCLSNRAAFFGRMTSFGEPFVLKDATGVRIAADLDFLIFTSVAAKVSFRSPRD